MATLKTKSLAIPQCRTYKTGLHLSASQQRTLQSWISGCHHLYNLYLNVQYGLLTAYHKQYTFKQRQKLKTADKKPYFINAAEFEKVFNHIIKISKRVAIDSIMEIPQKSRKQAFRDAELAFSRYFKHQAKRPRFKGFHAKRSLYFSGVKNVQMNKIRLPKLGFVQLEEYNYLPTKKQLSKRQKHVIGIRISEVANQWYIALSTNENQQRQYQKLNPQLQLGIDLGIKDFAILSNQVTYINITKSHYYQHLINYKKRYQKAMSRRRIKGSHTVTKRYCKTRLRYAKWCRRIAMYMNDYIEKKTNAIVQMLPSSITLEHLNVQGMKRNHRIASALQKLPLYKFKQLLIWKAKKVGIEVREVDQWYPSTKRCHNCGYRNNIQFHNQLADLQIRTFKCPHCGFQIDRDYNAALNLRDATEYTILTNKQQDFKLLSN